MRNSRSLRAAAACLAAVLVGGGVFAVQRLITTRAFDRLEAGRDAQRIRVALDYQLLALTGVVAAALAAALLLGVRRAVRAQVGPLRRTAEAVVDSGDRSVRVGSAAPGEIGALGRAIDGMLDALAAQEDDLRRSQAAREEQLRVSYATQRQAEQDVRARAQEVIDQTTAGLLAELQEVTEGVQAVRAAADTIDGRVAAAAAVTGQVVGSASAADDVVAALQQSLDRLGGMADLISTVAAQTKLLALNATIEAVRAGVAGSGFAVVAHEVKELAATTARSTAEISDTIGSLRRDAIAMSDTIAGMAEGIRGVESATGEVGEVTGTQRDTVVELDRVVRHAIERLHAMTDLTERLERRASRRIATHTEATLRAAGREHTVRLVNLSPDGVRADAAAGLPVTAGERVEVTIGTADGRLVVPGTVVRVRPDRGRTDLGLQLEPGAATEQYERYLDTLAVDLTGTPP